MEKINFELTTRAKIHYPDLKNWPIFSLLEPEFVSEIHMVMVYGINGNELLIVMKNKMVYALGSNKYGCLGIGSRESTFYPKEVKKMCGKDVKTFACSVSHVLALAENGEVYSWGYNSYGQLGSNKRDDVIDIPELVKLPTTKDGSRMKRVVDIACGNEHSLVLTEEGELFAWGYNYCEQGRSCEAIKYIPCQIENVWATKKIVQIACGWRYCIMMTDSGEVYIWGTILKTAIEEDDKIVTPRRYSSLEGVIIVKVACGQAHVLALTVKGEFYTWGLNSKGQLGIGNKTKNYEPKMVQHKMGRVYDIAAVSSMDISVAVGEGGRVYVWGCCRSQKILVPMLTQFTTVYDAIACYEWPSIMHKPLIVNTSEELEGIFEYLKNAFNDKSTSDLTIQVENQPIYVHKAILKIRCLYFNNMFQHNWLENNQTVIEHDQFSYTTFEAFLKYLYTDVIYLPPEKAFDLLVLADAYCEDSLKRRCIQLIKHAISVANVIFLYTTAIKHNAKEMEDFCVEFALNHMSEVVQTEDFTKLDANTMSTLKSQAAKAGVFNEMLK